MTPGRQRLFLAIPPVGAPSPFSYKSTQCVCFVCDEAGEGVRKPMATILLIDDDDQVRMLFQVALEGAWYRSRHHRISWTHIPDAEPSTCLE